MNVTAPQDVAHELVQASFASGIHHGEAAVDVIEMCSGVYQALGHLHVPIRHRNVSGRPAFAIRWGTLKLCLSSSVRIGPMLQQQPRNLVVPAHNRKEQRRCVVVGVYTRICAPLKKQLNDLEMTVASGL